MTQPLYDNHDGYSTEARRLSSKVCSFVEDLIREYPEYNSLELVGLIVGAVTEAHCGVSIDRRLRPKRDDTVECTKEEA